MSKIYYFQSPNTGEVYASDNPDIFSGYKKLTTKEGAALYKQQAKESLLRTIKPDDTIHTVLRSASRSGLKRSISLFIVKDNKLLCLDHDASVILERSRDKDQGIIVNGCGMDMGFDLVYNLGCALWPAGTPNPHGTRNYEPDSSGGYALKQQWL